MLESNYDQDIKFITGFAGSGKSTKLASLATNNTLILTPTHKAADVLRAKGVLNVYTIHSTLKLVPHLDQNYRPGEHQMQRLTRIGDTNLSSITDVFIDEFSMISMSILDLLLSLLPTKAKVTVFGDPYQLPPIQGEAIDPLYYTDNIEELTTQYRADAPEVVETFMRFMEYIKTGSGMNLKFNPKIQHGTIASFNPDTDRALAYTNAKVRDINDQIAKQLGMQKEYSIGERLTANGIYCELNNSEGLTIYPKCMTKGKLMEDTALQLACQKTENDIEKYGTDIPYPTCNIVIDDVPYTIHYDVSHYQTQGKLKRDVEIFQAKVIEHHNLDKEVNLPEWCKHNRSAKFVKERGKAWSAYIAHQSLVWSLQRPYATTVHKSQGSEFSTVFIAQNDIKKAIRNGYYMQYARLMYVALSRAINKVIIIS